MNAEAIKEHETPRQAVPLKPIVIWFRSQWTDSLANSVWDDMTPFGRLTIWLPLWLLCYVSMVISLTILFILFLVYKASKLLRLDRIPKIFFTR